MQKIYRSALAAAVVALIASPTSAGELKLTIDNGLVTLVADQVPLSQILSEWARVGQTRIVNGEKLVTLVSLQLANVPEKRALDILLRSASGYLAAERKVPVAGASAFDRVMILPFSQAPAPSALPVAGSNPQPFVPRPMLPQPDFDDPAQLSPMVAAQQLQQQVLQQQQLLQQQMNSTPQTVPMPGMLPQGLVLPGQQQPQQTAPRPGFLPPPGAQPVKPPGGGGAER